MRAFSETLRYLSALTFVGLALVAYAGWRRRRLDQGRWAVLTFGCLAIATVEPLLEEAVGVDAGPVVAKAMLLALVGFPYFLYRFTTSFDEHQAFARPALAATIAVALAAIAVPLETAEDLTGPVLVFLGLFLAQWSFLALVTSIRLWRAGHGQPTLARRRMRTLALASTGLFVAILTAVAASAESKPAIDLSIQLLALVSALLFFIGFAPPALLRLAWRQPEQQALQEAMLRLMRTNTLSEVTDVLLPRMAGIVAADRVELIDARGEVIASHERDSAEVNGRDTAETDRTERPFEDVELSPPLRALRVWTNTYTPFFGHDEMRLLHALGVIADLALGRTALLEEERRVRDQIRSSNQELSSANEKLAEEVAHREAAERSLLAQADALREAREEAESANRAKSEFLSRMSHELRTPLNAILGFGQLLEMDSLEGSQRESVGHILKAGRHLLGLINEVLEIARIEAGRLTISAEAVSVGDVVREALDMARPLAGERNISLDVQNHDGVFVLADRQRLKQVLLNLLSNAIKYNREGGRVVISSERAADKLRIDVADTGLGLSDEQIGRLFTPFERLGAEGSDVQGTGLGLALSKSLVEVMEGHLSVRSSPGDGSVFSVELPLTKRPTMPTSGPDEESARRSDRLPAGATVLYIEDNTSNLRLVEQVLKLHSSARLFTAMQGGIGIDLARRHSPDIILLDLHLPDMDGEAVLRRLREDERTRDIPIVMISADATASSVRRLKEQGATDYMTKPLEIGRFLDVLAENLATKVA